MNTNVTWIELVFLMILLLLAATLLAPVKLRRMALALSQRGVQAIGLAAAIAAATFILWPAAAPERLSSALQPLADHLAIVAGAHSTTMVWVVAAAAVCLIAAPLAITIGFIRRLDTLSVVLRRMAGALHTTGGSVPDLAPVISSTRGVRDELDEAVRSMGATATQRPKQPRRRKVADMLDQ